MAGTNRKYLLYEIFIERVITSSSRLETVLRRVAHWAGDRAHRVRLEAAVYGRGRGASGGAAGDEQRAMAPRILDSSRVGRGRAARGARARPHRQRLRQEQSHPGILCDLKPEHRC